MSITSEEINFLVYRYLQESGFVHSSFTFFNESTIPRSNINGANVPPGALISLLQRGLQYKEMEVHLNEDGSETKCKAPFSAVVPHKCIVEDTDETMKEEDTVEAPKDVPVVPEEAAKLLKGHTKEVYVCAWNGKKEILATGGADNTARIWQVSNDPNKGASRTPVVLPHAHPEGRRTSDGREEVTILQWDPSCNFLATGALDGVARIWTSKGTLKQTLVQHEGPIFSLKWNKEGKYLLSGSADHTSIVWDAFEGSMKQQFNFHSAPTLDVDWRDNNSFATCSSDHSICVGEIGSSEPLRKFEGHQHEVNAIRWCPAGRLLASCSDDCTAKIWSMDSKEPLQNLHEHTKDIYTIEWSPTGAGSANSVLATASFDSTIKLWDTETGRCLHNLARHKEAVYSINFSPDGKYLASGSFDRFVHVWSVATGQLVQSYQGSGGIFEVCWNSRGDRLAACYDNNNVALMDFKM